LGAYKKLISELRTEDSQQFRNLKRVSVVEVQSIMDMLGPVTGRKNTAMRNAISVEDRFMVTFCFLA
jgi:hypothetical protein